LSKANKIEANYLHSFNRDSASAPTRDDHSLALKYSLSNRGLGLGASFIDISDGFSSDVGFVTRTGITKYNVYISPKIFPKNSIVKRIDPIGSATITKDKSSGLLEHSYWANLRFTLPKNSNVSISYNNKTEIYLDEEFQRNSFRFSASSQITKRLRLNVSYGRSDKIKYEDTPYQGYGNDASVGMNWQVTDNFNSQLNYIYSDFYRRSNDEKIFEYGIIRSRNTYQLNKYLFFRIIVENNSFRNTLSTDFLASFTYIPGTVIHLGYGSLYEKVRWEQIEYIEDNNFHETVRGFFFKASYLFRK